MIIQQHVDDGEIEEMLAFYRLHFDLIDLVSCNKCGAYLCFELMGPDSMGMATDDRGRTIVPIGDNMGGSRVRLDVAPTGEPMIGYQCFNRVENPNYEQEHAEWVQARYEWDAEQAKKISDYQDQHEKQLEPLRKKYQKLVDAADKEHRKAVKKLGPGDPMPTLVMPAFDDSEVPEYSPPAIEPFEAPEPQVEEPCGNDTRMGEAEIGLVPTDNNLTHLSPFEKHKIREQISSSDNVPEYKSEGKIKTYETFSVERIK